MKYQKLWLVSTLALPVLANPLQVDINIDLNPEDVVINKHPHNKLLPDGHKATAEDIKVDLGYEVHKASPEIKSNQMYYNFSNIPYAQQPVGELRFKAAKALSKDEPKNKPVNDGQYTVICPQEQVGWVPIAKAFNTNLFSSPIINSKWKYPITPANYTDFDKIPPMPQQNESCLTLDITVPKRLWNSQEGGAPVMVLFNGGGFIFGSKHMFSGEGLLEAAAKRGDDAFADIILVSVNYRLGAFGWLAGDGFEKAGGFENAGFSDQVAALNWVKEYIHLFGGNPESITVFGESAGASSILHHITSYGGARLRLGPPPVFHRAILQSPAFLPVIVRSTMQKTYEAFLAEAGAKTFKDLQNAKIEDLIYANRKTTYNSPYGIFAYGPVVDNTFVLGPVGPVLRGGLFWNIPSMVSYNRREGSLFSAPWLRTRKALRDHILELYPKFDSDELNTVVNELYPLNDEGTVERDKIQLVIQLFGDFGVNCNAHFMAKAGIGQYQYLYNFYPGFHGQDIGATFYPYGGEELTEANNRVQSERLQRYLVSFAESGDPSADIPEDEAFFEPYADDQKVMRLGVAQNTFGPILPGNDRNFGMDTDPTDTTRCDFWESAPFWGSDDDFSSPLMRLQLQDAHQMQNAL